MHFKYCLNVTIFFYFVNKNLTKWDNFYEIYTENAVIAVKNIH